MYRVTAFFKTHKVSKLFDDMYDAIDFKDSADAHYPIKVTLETAKRKPHVFAAFQSRNGRGNGGEHE